MHEAYRGPRQTKAHPTPLGRLCRGVLRGTLARLWWRRHPWHTFNRYLLALAFIMYVVLFSWVFASFFLASVLWFR